MWEDYALLAVFVIGECISIYLYRAKLGTAAILFSSTSLLLGSIAFAGIYYALPQIVTQAAIVSWLLSMVVVVYSASKNARALALLFIPGFIVVQIVSPSLSIVTYLSLLTLVLGLVLADSLSEIDLMPFNIRPTTFRVLAAPFRRLETLVVHNLGKRSRPVLFLFYFLFTVLLTAIPILVGELLPWIAQPEILQIVSLAYFSFLAASWREARDGISSST